MTMLTKWGAALDRSCPLPEYPRPQLRRESFYNLNGVWDYAVTPSGDEPGVWDGEIVVPFSPEAPLSGAARGPTKDEYLHYRRGFTLPEGFQKSRVLLHFGAVDQIAEVFVNGVSAAKHSGGYWPFSADITSLLREGENILRVTVRDNADDPTFAYGKQRYKRGGMWYTAQSGIWQTVWLESVPEAYVKSLRITPEFDEARVRIELETALESSAAITCDVRAADGSFVAGSWAKGGVCVVPLPGFRAWTPDDPYLYTLDISCGEDRVESYFAMRKFSYVELGGHKVFGLNNVPLFHNGLLDQGYWPDGIFTAPTDEALRYDIELAKRAGFNVIRKHIKVEPQRWYYYCDRLGLMVWQDMPNLWEPDGADSVAVRKQFRAELKTMIDQHVNSPSIVMWVPFNENWGAFEAPDITDWVKRYDTHRLVNGMSGYNYAPGYRKAYGDPGNGDFVDMHHYGNIEPNAIAKPDDKRAASLGEFGGKGLFVRGHMWPVRNDAYEMMINRDVLTDTYVMMATELEQMVNYFGLSTAIYTQTTDVEHEINGLVTYDRQVEKMNLDKVREINTSVIEATRRK